MLKPVEKVVAYITRENRGRAEVLVFHHRDFPEVGVQVPAGTVLLGENLESAVIREAEEETGLKSLQVTAFLGCFKKDRNDRGEMHSRNVFRLAAPENVDEKWTHKVRGDGDDRSLSFDFHWMGLEEAAAVLAIGLGEYLHLLK